MSNSLQPHGLWPARLLCPWNSPGKNTGEGGHSLLLGIFPTERSNLGLPHCRQSLYPLSHQGSPRNTYPTPKRGALLFIPSPSLVQLSQSIPPFLRKLWIQPRPERRPLPFPLSREVPAPASASKPVLHSSTSSPAPHRRGAPRRAILLGKRGVLVDCLEGGLCHHLSTRWRTHSCSAAPSEAQHSPLPAH